MPILTVPMSFSECKESAWKSFISKHRRKVVSKYQLLSFSQVEELTGLNEDQVRCKAFIKGQRAFWLIEFKSELSEMQLEGTETRDVEYFVYPKEVFKYKRDQVERQAKRG